MALQGHGDGRDVTQYCPRGLVVGGGRNAGAVEAGEVAFVLQAQKIEKRLFPVATGRTGKRNWDSVGWRSKTGGRS